MHPLAGYEAYNCENWGGYDEKPITPETLVYARRLLELMPDTLGWPEIAPGGDGSVGLEWVPAGNAVKLFFDVDSGSRWRAYWRWPDGKTERQEGGNGDDAAELAALFAKFADPR